MRIRRSLRLRLFGSALIPAVFASCGLVAGLSLLESAPPAAAAYLTLFMAGLLGGALAAHHTYTLLTQAIERVVAALRDLGQGRAARTGATEPFSELHTLAQAANANGDALLERQHELDDQLRRTALLTRLAIDLRAAADPAAIARATLTAIELHSSEGEATIVLTGPDGAIELAQSMAGGQPQSVPPAQARQALEDGPAAHVWRDGGVLLANAASGACWHGTDADQPAGSVLALPLAHGGATFGVLTLSHPSPGHFSSHDLLQFEAVAAQASMALRAAHLRLEAQRRRDQALLLAIGQSVTPERSAGQLAADLLERSAAAFDADATALFLTQSDGAGLSCFAIHATPPAQHGEAAGTLIDDLGAIAGRAWQTGVPISEQLPEGAHAGHAELGRPSCIALPLRHDGQTIGIFTLTRRTHGTLNFAADTWALLAAFGTTIAAMFARPHLNGQQHTDAQLPAHEPGAALTHSRDPMHTIFDHLPDGLLLLDGEGRIMIANDAFCEDVLGMPPRAAIGRDYAAIIAELERCGQIAIEPHPCMAPARRARCDTSARQRWYDVERYTAEAGAGIEHVIERWRVVSRLEGQLGELAHDQQPATMARLAAGVVHEIGNPLQSLRSCIDLCREDPTLATPTAEYLELASGELRHMSQILGRLRDLYRQPLSEKNHE